jgi:hypothetical protein
MLSKENIDRMFLRKKLSSDQIRRSEEIEKKAHELALLVKENCGRPNKTMEEAILYIKKAAMLSRCSIAQEDREDY